MKTKTTGAAKQQHTPGPWNVSGCRMQSKGGIMRPMIEHGDESTVTPLIAELYDRGDRDRMEADARLIAAAPDLLVALKRVAARYDGKTGAMSLPDISETVRAAIAKAEGREAC